MPFINNSIVIENELINLSMVYGKKHNSGRIDDTATELRDLYTFLKGVENYLNIT